MRSIVRLAALALLAVAMTGCRFKGYESFTAATSPNTAPAQRGDVYGNGGTADASGGLTEDVQYGRGASAAGTVKPSYDQPQKGSGNLPGEYPNVASSGHAQTNAPAFQPSPSDVNALGH